MIYFLNLIILSVDSLFERLIKSRFFLIFSSIVLILFAGLRSSDFLGDSGPYASDYSIYLNKVGKGQFEIGFSLLEKICSLLNLSVTGFFIIVALISILFLTLAFKHLTIFPASALLYYYSRFFINRDMNQIRAGLAASVIMFAIYYLVNDKPSLFILFVLIATSMHKGAIIALFIYPINKFMNKKIWALRKWQRLLVYLFILTAAFLLSRIDSNFISKFIGQFDQTYVSGTSDYGKISYGIANPVIWLQVLIGLFSIVMNSNQNDERIKLCVSSYVLSTFLLISFSGFYVLAGRLSTILSTVEPILILGIVNKNISNKILSWVVFSAISIIVFLLINCYGLHLPTYMISI